eukprot:g46514.t1
MLLSVHGSWIPKVEEKTGSAFSIAVGIRHQSFRISGYWNSRLEHRTAKDAAEVAQVPTLLPKLPLKQTTRASHWNPGLEDAAENPGLLESWVEPTMPPKMPKTLKMDLDVHLSAHNRGGRDQELESMIKPDECLLAGVDTMGRMVAFCA